MIPIRTVAPAVRTGQGAQQSRAGCPQGPPPWPPISVEVFPGRRRQGRSRPDETGQAAAGLITAEQGSWVLMVVASGLEGPQLGTN